MLSFKIISEENLKSLTREMAKELGLSVSDEISEIICGVFQGCDEDSEVAVAASHGTLLFRIFDYGRYAFLFPYEVSSEADIKAAISDISKYAIREELSLLISDVPCESLGAFSGFLHMDLDAEDSAGESYSVRIKTECELLDDFPEIEYGRVKLNAITEADIELFAALSKSEEINRYWGYDYREDAPNPSDAYFYECAMSDFKRGVALSLAIRYEDKFAGEACIFAFDGRGGAEYAVRLLPEYLGVGLGREASLALFKLAESFGLQRLYAEILKENKPSVKMASSIMRLISHTEDRIKFVVEF